MKLSPIGYALAAACGLAALPAAFAAAPTAGILSLPKAAEIAPACDAAITAIRAHVKTLEALPLAKANVKTILGGWNRLDQLLQDIEGPIGLEAETHPDPEVRKAAESCELKLAGLPNEYLQSSALYQRVKALKTKNPVDAQARQDILDEFEARGVALPADKRARAKEIFERLDKLSQDFARNTRDVAIKVPFTEAELKGVPALALKDRAKDEQGRFLFSMDYPEYDAIMNNAEIEATRKVFWTAFQQRGGKQNLALLSETIKLRLELAHLMGKSNFADWQLKTRMAGSANAVNTFLNDVAGRVEALEKKELAELQAEKQRVTGDAKATLQRWDVSYYQEALKKSRYALDQAEVRAQFPVVPTIDWMLAVSSQLYGVKFSENKTLPVWQQDVRGFDVFDAHSGKYLSSFYLDLFPREGKYKHAAAFPVRRGSTLASITPVSVLVTNFNRNGFDQRELETLFHEFGHILHGVLSKTQYILHSGTSVKRDFVEAPSQIYEEWSRRPESLALFAKVCPSCKPIDPKLIERMNTARAFGQGIRYARQRLYAAWDMALHTDKVVDPMAAWVELESKTPLGHVEGTIFPASFGHVMRGYASGYYGYMWSEVLALDMQSSYGKNVMDTKVGARYRKVILEQGGQQHPSKLVQSFLGRKPSPDAFFQEITGQRHGG